MSNISYYRKRRRSPLLALAQQMAVMEFFWPIPLLAVAMVGVTDPILVGGAVAVALIPWLTRLAAFGHLTRPVFIGGSIGLFLIGGGIGLWAAYDPALSWPVILSLLASVFLFFAIANATLSPRVIAKGLVLIAGLLALYFVGQYGHFELPFETGRLARLGRVTGSILPEMVFFTPHPNAVAGFLEGTLLLSLVLTWRTPGPERIGWGLLTGSLSYALLITGSRGSWLGLMVVIGLWAVLSLLNQSLRLAITGGGALLVAAGIGAILWPAPSGYQNAALNSALETAGSRLTLYENSLHLLKDYFFTGLGPGETFAMVYSRYLLLIQVPFLTYSHNLILSVWLGFGLLGMIALVWLLVAFYRFVIQVERIGLRERWYPIFRAAWLGVTAILIHGLTDSPQFGGANWTLPMLFALLGLVIATGHLVFMGRDIDERQLASLGRLNRWEWAGLGLAAAVVMAVAAIFWRPLVSAGYANLGAVYHTQADLSPNLDDSGRDAAAKRAVSYYAAALTFYPDQPTANRRMGLLALDRHKFETAIAYLEPAYQTDPGNQANLKALGLAYLWNGQLELAESLLRQVERLDEVITELETWRWWWGTQDRPDLAAYADEMVHRLSTDTPED